MKNALPENAMIAKETSQECVSEFSSRLLPRKPRTCAQVENDIYVLNRTQVCRDQTILYPEETHKNPYQRDSEKTIKTGSQALSKFHKL